MTKNKSTKRAFLASILSLLLCMAMLIGSTFAWFTDSVTTGKNTIVAGNLDVELYSRQLNETTDEYEYVAVGAGDSLFDENTLWEPGHTEVVYLKVANLGTLALKYKLAVTVEDETPGTNVAGEDFNLSEYLVFGQVTDTEEIPAYKTRAEAQEAVKDATQGLKDFSKGSVLYSEAAAQSDSTKTSKEYVALVVYMPETVGNEANYLTGTTAPSITLGVTLVATQTPYERDSYDEMYDENAVYPTLVSTADELKDVVAAAADGDVIALTSDVALSADLTVSADVTISGNGNAIEGYPVYVSTGNTVTFQNVNFANTTAKTNASSVYGSGFSGTMVFDGCEFGDSNWESIQITPKGDAEIIIRNCTFTATKDMKRFIHIQPADNNNYKLDITIENCTFEGCDMVNYNSGDTLSVIDLDYIAAGSTLTLGGCTFNNTDGTECTGAHAYFCRDSAGSYTRTYSYDDMYAMLTGVVQTYTVE